MRQLLIAAFLLVALIGCEYRPPVHLGPSSSEAAVSDAVGETVVVWGHFEQDDGRDIIRAKHFSALVELRNGGRLPYTHKPMELVGTLTLLQDDPYAGYRYRIVDATYR
jgi:hypothetical protein